MKKIITCLLTFGLATSCCQQNYVNRQTHQEQNGASSSYALKGEERQYVNTDTEGFAKLIAEPGVVVLDVRTAEEFNEGHIEGALLIDWKQDGFLEKAQAVLPKDRTIAVYCRSGRRSAGAAEMLAAEGYKLVNLDGGILAWKEANRPVTTGTTSK